MRRIYESEALDYDDDDPHAPTDRDGNDDPGPRTIDWTAASHALFPTSLREWAIDVDIETDREVYPKDIPIRFEITFRNRLPFPISIQTTSRIPWIWDLNGLDEASHISTPPEGDALFQFSRAERKTFTRRWKQRIRQDARTWIPADRGEYTLGVRIVTPDAMDRGLAAETTFRIE